MATLPATQLAYFDTTALGGLTYSYRLQSVDWFAVVGDFSPPLEASYRDLIPPDPPDSLSVTPSSEGLFVAWKFSEEPDIADYGVYRSVDGGPFEPLASATFASYSDASVEVAVPYRYAVTAVDYSGNESGRSEAVDAVLPDLIPPGAPHEVAAVGIAEGIRLSWLPPADTDLEGFVVSRSSGRDEYVPLVELPRWTHSWLDTTALERRFYVYKVEAFDGSGNVGEPAFAQTLRPDLRAPEPPVGFFAQRSGHSIGLTWDPSPAPDLAEYRLRMTIVQSGASVTEHISREHTSFLHTPFGRGIPLAYQLAAADSSGNVSPPSIEIRTALVPDSFSVSVISTTLGHPDRFPHPGYRLVSFPGEFQVPFSRLFSGERGTDWEVLGFENLRPMPDQRPEPATSYWAYSRARWPAFLGPVAQVDTGPLGYTFDVSVQPGWTQIANPFDIAVAWADVLYLNGVSGALYAYDGHFTLTESLLPFEGYVWFNRDGRSALRIPYSAEIESRSLDFEQVMAIRLSAPDWSRQVTLAMADDASGGLDSLDALAPPTPFGGPELAFVDESGLRYRRLVIPPTETRELRLGLGVNVSETATLSLEHSHSGFPNAYIEDGSRVFRFGDHPFPVSAPAALTLVLSPEPAPLVPLGPSVSLVSTYPEPFGSTATIEFELPEEGFAMLKAFDLIGRQVSSIAAAQYSSGLNRVVWRVPETVGSGLLLLTVESKGRTDSAVVHHIR